MNSKHPLIQYRPLAFQCLGLMIICFSGCASLLPGLADRKEHHSGIDSDILSRSEQANVCLQTGLRLAEHQKDDHAIAQLKKARNYNSKLPGIAHPLAVLYDRQGRFGLAEQEYKRAMSEEEPSSSLLNDFGYFRYVQGQLDDAAKHLQHALRIDPEYHQASTNLAMVRAAQGDFDGAYQLFETAVGSAAAHQNVGLLLLRGGQEEQALAHLEQATTIDPSLETASLVVAANADRNSKLDSGIRAAHFEE